MQIDLAVHMVVKNDAFYVLMAIQSVLPYVKGVYVQDQMSTDGTFETVFDFAQTQKSGSITIERVDTGCGERFEKEYDEPYWRTQALKRTEETYNTEWLLKADADEIYTPYFFAEVEKVLTPEAKFNCIRVSGERFISRDYLAGQLQDDLCHYERSPDGTLFIDPHTQLWRSKHSYYVDNPAFPGSHFHPCLDPDPAPQLWLPGICNVHLHRLFGPKSLAFWREGGDIFDEKARFHAPSMAPIWYNSKVNRGCAAKVKFDWPDYVLKKWEEWGYVW